MRRQFNRFTNDFGPTKGKRMRTVPCPSVLRNELRELMASDQVPKTKTIFRNEQGLPICHDNFADRQFARDLQRWGNARRDSDDDFVLVVPKDTKSRATNLSKARSLLHENCNVSADVFCLLAKRV